MKINFNPIHHTSPSFGKVSAVKMIEKIGKENFPSPVILENLQTYGRRRDVTLYEIHSEYYAPLLNCETLDEAKELYPEFRYVKDAKDVDKKDMTEALRALFRQDKNISLNLLKKYYAQCLIPNDNPEKNAYEYTRKSIERMFQILNIQRYNPIYAKYLTQSKPEHIEKQSQTLHRVNMENPQLAKDHAEKMREIFSSNERRKAHSNLIREISNDPAFVQKQRERTLEQLKNHPELALTKSIACSLHPEILQISHEVASNYPYLASALKHIEQGKPLTRYERGHLFAYNREIAEKCPEGQKIIGQEQRLWLEKYRNGEVTIEELEEMAQKLKKVNRSDII